MQFVIQKALVVWPLIHTPVSQVGTLNSAIVASQTDSKQTLEALVAAGSRITLPPAYIVDLVCTSGLEYTLLSPETAYRALLVGFPFLASHNLSDARFLPSLTFYVSALSPQSVARLFSVICSRKGTSTILSVSRSFRC